MPKKGCKVDPNSKQAAGKLRPHAWITGTDPLRHEMYHPWQLAKAQANFRGEGWDIDYEDYYKMWKPFWSQRGRAPDCMCMTRTDYNGDWTLDNVEIITREEHFKRQGIIRKETGRVRGKTKGTK